MNLIVKANKKIYESFEEIPTKVKKFIKQHETHKPLYNFLDDKVYCSFCLSELDDNGKCICCGKKYENYINKDEIDINRNIDKSEVVAEENINNVEISNFFFFLQNIDGKVLLYVIKEKTNYECETPREPIKEFSIYNIYSVKHSRIEELIKNEVISYKVFKDNIIRDNVNDLVIFGLDCSGYLYTDNLDDLKDTIYKDSNMWNGKEFLKNNEVSIKGITYFPIRLPMFKYLIKIKLSNLAFNSSDVFKKEASFENTLGINKKFLPFIQEHNVSKEMIRAIRLCNTTDMEVLAHALDFINFSFFSDLKGLVKIVSLEEVYKYFNKIGLGYKYIHFYIRYLEALKKNKKNISSKEILFPKDLLLECSKLGISLNLNWVDRG